MKQISTDNGIAGLYEAAKQLPLKPGIYMHFDSCGHIIYVGKSKLLKNRVSSYFQSIETHGVKTKKLVSEIAKFEYIVTNTEAEALILENELIKLHNPKYNIKLKDGKNYPYLVLNVGDKYPRLSLSRRRDAVSRNVALYFGPYSSSKTVYSIIDAAKSIFRLPSCEKVFPRDIGKTRPCLYKHLGRCIGVCTGEVSEEEYRAVINKLIMFLRDDYTSVANEMKSEMEKAAEELKFEHAARLRDMIEALKSLKSRQKIVGSPELDADIFGLYCDNVSSVVSLLAVRGGRICDMTSYEFGADEILDPESFSSFLVSLYKTREFIPQKIFADASLFDESDKLTSEMLSETAGHSVRVLVPERGDNRALCSLACENAKEYAENKRKAAARDDETLLNLAQLLHLGVIPERIEAYDISNSGNQAVTAGMIVCKNGRFLKRAYRSFGISTDGMPDDYAAMSQALERRIKRAADGDDAFLPLPDLILVDGGKGHVACALKVLRAAGQDIPVYGMVKDDFHKTRCLTDGENDISIANHTQIFRFIYGIQEEVHRFSLSRMDTKRRKSVKTSSLTVINGIGEAKSKALLAHFGSLKGIKEASEEALSRVKGVNKADAENIFAHFNPTIKKD